MNKHKGFIRLLSLTAALCVTVSVIGGGEDPTKAEAYYDSGYDGG